MVEVTLHVSYPLLEFGDIAKLGHIKNKVRVSGGKIEPMATVKPLYMNATNDWFYPQFKTSDTE